MEGLAQVRDELLPLLYYSYLRLYMSILRENLPIQLIKKWKNDFLHVEKYMEDIRYLESLPQPSNEERIKDEKKLHEILTSRKVVTMSQFTFESLFLFIQKNNLQQVDFDVLQGMKINLELRNEPTKSILKKPGKEVLNLTEERIRPGIRKDEALYMHLLKGIKKAQKHEGQDFSLGKLGKYIPPFGMEIQEEKTIPLPETQLKFQIDFAKAFLSYKPHEKTTEPNILHISVQDPSEAITCMEIQALGNILLVGFSNATILMVVLNPKFREKTDVLEGYMKESLDDLTSSMNIESIYFEEENSPKDENKMLLENQNEGNGTLFGEYKEKQTDDNKRSEKYEIIEFVGHEEAITSLHLHYDEQYFLSSSVDTTIRFWCIRSRTCLGIFKGHINTIWKTKFASRGLLFASGSSDKTARLWNTSNCYAIRTFVGHTSDVHLVDFSNDCNYVITASYDKSIRLWDVDNSQCFKILYPGTEIISALKLNFYSTLLASGLEDGTVVLWDLSNDTKLSTFYFDQDKRINSVDFSPDGKHMVVSSRKRISTYEVKSLPKPKDSGNINEEGINQNERKNFNEKDKRIEKSSVIFEDGGLEYNVMLTKFSAGNFVYALSRNSE